MGFVGNVLLKFAESLGGSAAAYLQQKLQGKLPDAELHRLSQSLYDLTNRSRKTSGPLFRASTATSSSATAHPEAPRSPAP